MKSLTKAAADPAIKPDPSNSIFFPSVMQYRKNHAQVFGEEFVAEVTAEDDKWSQL